MVVEFYQALRRLFRQRRFAVSVILLLSAGFSVNAAVYALVHGVLWRALPYPSPDKIVLISFGKGLASLSAPQFRTWQENNDAFEYFSGFHIKEMVLSDSELPEKIDCALVTSGFFQIFHARPSLGRFFQVSDHQPGARRTAVLAHTFWQRRLGGDAGVLGKHITLNGAAHLIIGIAQSDFSFPGEVHVWLPFEVEHAAFLDSPALPILYPLGKLHSGITAGEAESNLRTLNSALTRENPLWPPRHEFEIIAIHDYLVRSARTPLLLLMAAAALVFLFVAANAIWLTLLQAEWRRQEFAVRMTVGARPASLLRQAVIEGGVVSFAALTLALPLSGSMLRSVLLFTAVKSFPRVDSVNFDSAPVVFSLGLAVLTTILLGIAPATRIYNSKSIPLLGSCTRNLSSFPKTIRIRRWLVVCQLAITMVLLNGAGLLMRSSLRLSRLELGFETEEILTIQIDLQSALSQSQGLADIVNQLQERFNTLPNIESVGAVSHIPLTGVPALAGISIEGAENSPRGFSIWADRMVATPGYFRTMGIQLIRGREFSPFDREGSNPVVVVDASLADRYWPDEDALGRRIKLGKADSNEPWRTIVGVVGSVRNYGLKDVRPDPLDKHDRSQIYLPYSQYPVRSMSYVLKSLDTNAIAKLVSGTALAVDGTQGISKAITMEEIYEEFTAENRFYTSVLTIFAALTLFLAVIGVYCTVGYAVSRRYFEIGVRTAMGASPHHLLKEFSKEGLHLVAKGLLIGLTASLMLTGYMSSILFEISPLDLTSLLASAVVLVLAGMLSCLIPARQAMSIDPVMALRYE